ncbi:MAG: DEAD/DEAH box helicase [Deltaproteobacteria bacterium]|nr:DEAD/DEAH box helicase [Deltaproteobacteria bacterium]
MANIDKKIKVGISADFLKSYSKISKDKQTRVREFIEKFKGNPTSPGLNYEKVNNATDPNIRSVRINHQYCAIVLKPAEGDVYMLLWVDNHDDAYAWARNRQFQIHPETGALQVINVSETVAVSEDRVGKRPKGLFDDLRDRELLRLGIPKDLLPSVRLLTTEEELEASANRMPEEAFEALYMLAAGFSQEEVYQQVLAQDAATSVDTKNFAAALKRRATQRQFALLEDDIELREMLTAPLERWRVFLHPSQRRIVRMKKANGPVRVLGGAGTGKTVVAMHRAKWLAENVFMGENDRILVTTFTRNLATDIKTNLQKLCSADIMRRIEVINIDAWVARFLKQNGYDHQIVFEQQLRPLFENALNQADEALQLPDQFYRDEWDMVIQQQGLSDLASYVRASRTGRGRRLSRRDRPKVWTVFEEYRSQLNDRRFKELIDAARDARHLLAQRGDVLPYRTVIVDEAQDMNAEVFRLIRQMIPVNNGTRPNEIFITGDAHQRIYGHRVVLSHCGIDIRGRGRKLRINYRTTEETRSWAVCLLEGQPFDDLDGGEDEQRGYKSLMHGPTPALSHQETFAAEVDVIVQHISNLIEQGTPDNSVCLVARTNDMLAQFEGALRSRGHQVYRIRRSTAEDRKASGIRLATMHRVNGLEFEHVIVAGVNQGIVPLAQAMTADNPHEQAEGETRERSLLYVAATRAKQTVLITSSGTPSRFLVQPYPDDIADYEEAT